MAESSEKPAFRLRLLVDKKKDKVVLAEVGKDFVDVLFSFLTFPMGTIVRLLEKFQQNQKSQDNVTVGCFHNLYRSVLDMSNDDFLTKACKQILLYPRSVKEKQCRRLKVNIDDTEVLKYYKCPNLRKSSSCTVAYSNFCSSRCFCGELMMEEVEVTEDGCDEIYVSQKTSFIITENMKVGFASIALTLTTLRGLGYTHLEKLEEMFVDVNHKEVVALFHCLFSSETPLTDVFLKKSSSCGITRSHNMPSLSVQVGGEADSNEVVSLTVFVRKQDRKVLYAESGQDFVDLLFNFLVLPLEFVCEISGSNAELGCFDNVFKSMKSLGFTGGINASTNTCTLPWHYSFQKLLLLDVCYEKNFRKFEWIVCHNYKDVKPVYPNFDGSSQSALYLSSGIVKRGATYMISDDLTITAANSSSVFCIMKKWDVDLDDIEEHVININKPEAYSLLRASLMTSTALTSALGSLLPKKPKDEKL